VASDDLIEIDGVIKEVFPGGAFLVETDAGTQLRLLRRQAKLSQFQIYQLK
jgi:translation initiation factor IF-1